MKKFIALFLITALLCGCANTAEPGTTTVADFTILSDIIVTDHSLQDIVFLGSETPEGTNLPRLKRPETGDLLWFEVTEAMNAFLLRGWAASDMSAYKNGNISLEIKGNGSFDIGFGETADNNYTTAVITVKESSADWKTILVPVSEINTELKHVRDLVIGNASGNIAIRNIKLISDESEKIYPEIKVNQLGFKPESEKTAFVTGFSDVLTADEGTDFSLVDKQSGESVYSGKLTLITELDELYSGEKMLLADFSEYKTEGEYYLKADNLSNSVCFRIGENVYDELLCDSMRYFYYQRANTEITSEYGGDFVRTDITPEDINLPLKNNSDITMDVSGGWYDAGDIGKYVTPGATAVNTLLWTYKLFPEKFSDGQNNIPESGNGIPDILDEIRYETDFFLRMQDNETGAFYMKVKSATEDDNAKNRAIWEYTTNSTADTSAALAFASTIFREFDPEYADRLRESAEKGWEYIEKNPDYYVETTYSGEKDNTSSFWAAGSLFYATENEKYHNFIKENFEKNISALASNEDGHSVSDMGIYGLYMYAMSDGADEILVAEISDRFSKWKRNIVKKAEFCPWNIAINDWSFWWGSFNIILGGPMDIYIGNHIFGNDNAETVKMSQNALNFILGANAQRKSYVTGHGEDSISCTFSSFYGYHEKGFPDGYMPGGINQANGSVLSKYPIKCYNDEAFDWFTNENAIYWNAVLVFNTALSA